MVKRKFCAAVILLCVCYAATAYGAGLPEFTYKPSGALPGHLTVQHCVGMPLDTRQECLLVKALRYPFRFFDGVKLQITNSYPKLTHVKHQIDFVNAVAQTNLRDWDSMDIFTLDLVVWKELTKYLKVDFAVAVSSGALLTSDTAFRTTLRVNTRFRQRYDILMLWSNIYFYPLTYNYKDNRPNRLIDPFFALGLGCSILREETAIKFRKGAFYDRVVTNFNDIDVAYKVMAGIDLNLGRMTERLERYGLTFTVYKIWNRLEGHANTHLTEGLSLGMPVGIDLHYKEPMDVDITGLCFSLALSYRF